MMTTTMPLRRTMAVLVLMVACGATIACGSARRREPLRVVPDLDERAVHGQIVFMAQCHQCHPGGEAGLGPAINDKPFPGFLMKFQVRHGLGAMPSFPKQRISDQDLDALMGYLSALRRSRPAPSAARAGS